MNEERVQQMVVDLKKKTETLNDIARWFTYAIGQARRSPDQMYHLTATSLVNLEKVWFKNNG